MADEKTVEFYNVKDTDQIICMVQKVLFLSTNTWGPHLTCSAAQSRSCRICRPHRPLYTCSRCRSDTISSRSRRCLHYSECTRDSITGAGADCQVWRPWWSNHGT